MNKVEEAWQWIVPQTALLEVRLGEVTWKHLGHIQFMNVACPRRMCNVGAMVVWVNAVFHSLWEIPLSWQFI